MVPPHPVEFRICHPAQPPAAGLLDAMVAELESMYGGSDGPKGVPLGTGELAPPAGRYLVGRVGPDIVAGGGLRTIGTGIGEIKRMYVVPSWRGRGVARLLLAALEAEAATMGLVRVRLDTGPRQPGARHLYLTSGYAEVADYNSNPRASFWGEKTVKG